MMYMDFSQIFHLENYSKIYIFNIGEHFYHKNPKFGEIEASLILKFGEIGALQNSRNLLKIRRDWSLPFGEIGVPRDTCR